MFKIDKPFGPPRLRKIHQQLVDWINQITPKAGPGVDVDSDATGTMISLQTTPPATPKPPDSTGGTSGTTEDIYGALNGAPALFHVVVSAPAEPIP